MVGKKIGFISILLLGAISSFSQSYRYLQYIPLASIKIDDIIKKYHLKTEDKDSLLVFNNLNASSFLEKGKKYKMPIRIYPFSGDNIRTSLNIDNYNTAKSIEKFNTLLEELLIKK